MRAKAGESVQPGRCIRPWAFAVEFVMRTLVRAASGGVSWGARPDLKWLSLAKASIPQTVCVCLVGSTVCVCFALRREAGWQWQPLENDQ